MPSRTKFSLSLKSVLQLNYWTESRLKCAQLYHQLESFVSIRENVNDEDLICESRYNSLTVPQSTLLLEETGPLGLDMKCKIWSHFALQCVKTFQRITLCLYNHSFSNPPMFKK